MYVLVQREVFINMYIICNYLHISGVLHPGESFWRAAALYDMCPKSTSSREGNGTPLQCSCLENDRDRGAWWAAVYGISQSQTRQKRLSSSNSSALSLGFHNIDSSPENVPPPTMSVQVSAPTSSQAHQHLRNLFGLFLINSLTDGPPVKRRYSSFMFTQPVFPVLAEREQAAAPQAVDPPFCVERSCVPSTGCRFGTKHY